MSAKHVSSGVWRKALACFGVLNTPTGKARALKAEETNHTQETQDGLPLEIGRTPCISNSVSSESQVQGANLPSAIPGTADSMQQFRIQEAQHRDESKPLDGPCCGTVGQRDTEQDNDSRLRETELFMESLLSDMKAIACAVSTLDTALSMDPLLLSAWSPSVGEASSAGFHGCHAAGGPVHGKPVASQLEPEDHSTPGYNMNQRQKLFNDGGDMELACDVSCHPSCHLCVKVTAKSETCKSTAPATSSSQVVVTTFSGQVPLAPMAFSPSETAAQCSTKAKIVNTRSQAIDPRQRHLYKTQSLELEAAPATKPCTLPSPSLHESPWRRSNRRHYCPLLSTSQTARCAYCDSDVPLSDPHGDTALGCENMRCSCSSNSSSDSAAMGCNEDEPEPVATHMHNARDADHGFSRALPRVVHSLTDLLIDVRDLSGVSQSGGGCVWLGTWRGMHVALKVFCLPRSQIDSPQLLAAVRASRLHHRNLTTVYEVRVCRVDEQALSELDPPPLLRLGWARAPRPMGRLQRFLAAHSERPLDSAQGRRSTDVDLTVLPGDVVVRPQPPATPDRQLLRSLCPELGSCVVAVLMEYCDMDNLLNIALAPDSPFHASRFWSLHVARRALLRTAREVASGLVALHMAGVTHGSLHPANVLCCRAPNDRRGFVARLADAGWMRSLTGGWRRSRDCGPQMVMLAPEALITGSGGGSGTALDVYAFGMLLYVMVAGQVPFRGQQLVPILKAMAAEGLRPKWPTGQHDHLEPLFLRCTAQCPEERPSAKQILAEICALEDDVKSSKPRRTKAAAASVPSSPVA